MVSYMSRSRDGVTCVPRPRYEPQIIIIWIAGIDVLSLPEKRSKAASGKEATR
jgi:hypothetical protein